ncbi:MAG TPA: thiamine phosphate synthase [Bacteroidia bacterium]|nr:thiamine phosphate synthase [Bacteroidia bacterium]
MHPELILISNEYDLPYELQIIHALFENGLERFHLRKPLWDIDSQRFFLEKIKPEFRERISLHQHNETAREFGIKLLHLREKTRIENNFVKEKDMHYSTSFHSLTQAEIESKDWEYCFLSPVFNSISKPGYNASFGEDLIIENKYKNIYALGGVDLSNINKVFEKGFCGAALLGSIWSEPEKAKDNFLLFKKECNKNVHTY